MITKVQKFHIIPSQNITLKLKKKNKKKSLPFIIKDKGKENKKCSEGRENDNGKRCETQRHNITHKHSISSIKKLYPN